MTDRETYSSRFGCASGTESALLTSVGRGVRTLFLSWALVCHVRCDVPETGPCIHRIQRLGHPLTGVILADNRPLRHQPGSFLSQNPEGPNPPPHCNSFRGSGISVRVRVRQGNTRRCNRGSPSDYLGRSVESGRPSTWRTRAIGCGASSAVFSSAWLLLRMRMRYICWPVRRFHTRAPNSACHSPPAFPDRQRPRVPSIQRPVCARRAPITEVVDRRRSVPSTRACTSTTRAPIRPSK